MISKGGLETWYSCDGVLIHDKLLVGRGWLRFANLERAVRACRSSYEAVRQRAPAGDSRGDAVVDLGKPGRDIEIYLVEVWLNFRTGGNGKDGKFKV